MKDRRGKSLGWKPLTAVSNRFKKEGSLLIDGQPGSYPIEVVLALYQGARRKSVWIGTQGWAGPTQKNNISPCISLEVRLQANQVSAIIGDRKGTVMDRKPGDGLEAISNGKKPSRNYKTEQGLANNKISALSSRPVGQYLDRR